MMMNRCLNIPLTIMLCVLFLLLITLCSANDNSSSSKPRDNKVSVIRRDSRYKLTTVSSLPTAHQTKEDSKRKEQVVTRHFKFH